jgi:hypothetical protein
MPIQFDDKGNPYPYEIVRINLGKFEEIFTKIPNKDRRLLLFQQLNQYINDFLTTFLPTNWIQWVGGSYTTTKKMPNDIDLVNFIDANSIESSISALSIFITNSDCETDSKKKYSVDGYLVPIFDEYDPRRKITVDFRNYWKKWFGHDRFENPKTVVEVIHK